ncbi:MAG: ribose 5-phosphate isomerase B [Clostridia bacterium]|nr:ribose 5-phosphate isomerase B [Clostridia bacterium]
MIAIGSDHGGFELKTHIIKYLTEQGYKLFDFGTYTEDSCDYPDIAEKVAKAVASGEYEKGILICGTGIGISIAANKVDGIRAALCGDVYSAKMTIRHNDANILCMGGRVTGRELAFMICDTFLSEKFDGGRHQNRIDKIHALEN